jgi:alkylation response protein AidB-like acyl-CoA dehydrogenase
MPGPAAHEEAEALDTFGDLIPYADPNWYQSYHSPYFNQSHADLRDEVRQWVEDEIMPNVTEWDEAKKVPDSIYKQMGERGYLAGLMGMHHWPTHLTKHTVKSVAPEKWDLFHEMLLTDELSRTGSGGFVWNVIGGFGIGCPPLVKAGKKELVDRVLPGILNGDKRICLAITEPDAGSDVANLTCEAKLTEDGKHYIVNGEKKWITNGIWCDYFTTAVRTGGEGMNGVSVLLIEREFEGVSTRRMDCQGVWSSGTTYVTFEDVKVRTFWAQGQLSCNWLGVAGSGLLTCKIKFAYLDTEPERWLALTLSYRLLKWMLTFWNRYRSKTSLARRTRDSRYYGIISFRHSQADTSSQVVMSNFNHERIGIIIQCLRFSRVCYEESMKYAHKRRTFGKKLIEHPVIRLKLAHMARQIESSYSWLENLVYQCQKMDDTEAMLKLGGAIGEFPLALSPPLPDDPHPPH